MLIPEQTQDPAQLRRIKRSPELQAATAQLVEVNARINRFVQFCNTVIVEIRDAPGARDKLKQRSQPCAS